MELLLLSRTAAAATSPFFSPRLPPSSLPSPPRTLHHHGRPTTKLLASPRSFNKKDDDDDEIERKTRRMLNLISNPGQVFYRVIDPSDDVLARIALRAAACAAAAAAAEIAFFRLLDAVSPAPDVPAWTPVAGALLLFAAALLGCNYGLLSASWDPVEKGSFLGWDEAVQHWNLLQDTVDSLVEEDDDNIIR